MNIPTDPTSAKAIIREIKESDGVIIGGYRSLQELVNTMQEAINDGKKCAFIPTQKTLRLFFWTQGFIMMMEKVNAGLENHVVLYPPNVYGREQKHVFAVAPRGD